MRKQDRHSHLDSEWLLAQIAPIYRFMIAMKKPLSLILLATGMILTAFVTNTQAQSECFIQEANGQHIDLSRLCGGSRGHAIPSASSIFKLPIKRRVNGIPTVDVTFNGRYRFEMLFDTGASGIVLTDDMAEAIGVEKEREVAANTAGGTVSAHLGRVSSVQAGNLVIKDLVVGISSHMDGLGLLGQNFFGSYDVTIKKDMIELRSR